MKKSIFFLGLISIAMLAMGQHYPNASEFLDANQVRALIHNGGDMFWDLHGHPEYEVPAGSGKHASFAAGLWMGGTDQFGQLHVAAQTYRQSGVDFFAGPLSNGNSWIPFISYNPMQVANAIRLSNDKMVIADKYDYLTICNPTDSTCIQRLIPQIFPFEYSIAEASNGDVLIVGGDSFPGPSTVFSLDTANYQISAFAILSLWHQNPGVLSLSNGQLIIISGTGAEMLDPVTKNTITLPSPPVTTIAVPAILEISPGKILYVPSAKDTSLIYDTSVNTWLPGPSLSQKLQIPEVEQLPSGEVLITDGYTTGSHSVYQIFDPQANQITITDSIFTGTGYRHLIQYEPGKIIINSRNGYFEWDQMLKLFNQVTGPSNIMNGGNVLLTGDSAIYVIHSDVIRKFDPYLRSFPDLPYDKIWKITRNEIDTFRSDFQSNNPDFTKYPAILDWPAHGDVSKGEDYYLAPFVDFNNDGKYSPYDGDYPCITGDQMLWTIFNDIDGPHSETGGVPVGVQVKQSAYAWDCDSGNCPDSSIAYTTFYHYEIENRSSNTYSEFYLGFWQDADMGYFGDDFIGSDSLLGLAYTYNGDSFDEQPNGYGTSVPALGLLYLNDIQGYGRMTNMIGYENDWSVYGNPATPQAYALYLQSRYSNGQHLVNDGGSGSSGAGVDADFHFSGDAGFCGSSPSGWTEFSGGQTPFDRRFVTSTGPYSFAPGQRLSLDFAVVWARDSSNLASVCKLKRDAAFIKAWHAQQPKGCFQYGVATDPEPAAQELKIWPNPARDRVNFELPSAAEAAVQVFDLNGRCIRTTLVRGTNPSLDVSDLPQGMYIIRINQEGLRMQAKVSVM